MGIFDRFFRIPHRPPEPVRECTSPSGKHVWEKWETYQANLQRIHDGAMQSYLSNILGGLGAGPGVYTYGPKTVISSTPPPEPTVYKYIETRQNRKCTECGIMQDRKVTDHV